MEEKIIEVEIIAGKAGVPVNELWRKLYEETGKDVYLQFASSLERGEPKVKVYADFLSEETLFLISEAEKKSLPLHLILEKYSEIREVVKKINSEIRAKSFHPLFTFFISAGVIGFMILSFLNTFLKISSSLSGEYGKSIENLSIVPYLYFPTVLAVLFFMVLSVFVIPHKVPYLSKIFSTVVALKILALTKVFYSAKIPFEGIIKFFKYSSGREKLLFENVNEYTEKGFTSALSNVLSPEETAILQIAVKTGMFENALNNLYELKKNSVKKNTEKLGTLVNFMTYLLILIPFSFFIFVYLRGTYILLRAVLNQMSGY